MRTTPIPRKLLRFIVSGRVNLLSSSGAEIVIDPSSQPLGWVGRITINVLPQFRDADALAADLCRHGIDAKVSTETASPSMVGQVELFAGGGGGPVPGIETGPDGSAGGFDWTIDPSRFSGVLEVVPVVVEV
jgi:hypothetical protein